MRAVTVILLILVLNASAVFAKEITFTQEDRERLIRVEEGLKAVNQRIDSLDKRIDSLDKRIDSLDKRIDDLKNLMYVLIGAVFAQTIGVVGFVLWDRRTALQPAIRRNKELEERQERIEKALKELARVDRKVEEILKNVGLL